MATEPKLNRWLALAFFLLVAGLLYWIFRPAPGLRRPAIAVVRFADGARVELIATAVGTELDDGYKASKFARTTLFGSETPVGEGSSGYSPETATVDRRSVAGEPLLRGARIVTPSPSLLLLLRGFDAQGQPGVMRWDWDGDDGSGASPATPPGKSPPLLGRVDVLTGDEWLPFGGPYQPLPTDPRAFCNAPIFPRRAPKLRLRFTQRGQPPVEVEIDNPQPSRAQPWKATEVLPVAKDAGGTRIELRFFRWERDQYGNWGTHLFASSDAPQGYFDLSLLSVEDASGNFAGPDTPITLPTDFGAWRARFEVNRGRSFPTPLAEAILMAEAEFVAVGEPLKIAVDPAFAKSFSKIAFKGDTGADPHSSDGGVNFHFTAEMKGTGSVPSFPAEKAWRIYVDDRPLAENLRHKSSGTSSSGSDFDLDFDQEWTGHMTPGTKFKLAIQKSTPPAFVEFLFDPLPRPAAHKN